MVARVFEVGGAALRPDERPDVGRRAPALEERAGRRAEPAAGREVPRRGGRHRRHRLPHRAAGRRRRGRHDLRHQPGDARGRPRPRGRSRPAARPRPGRPATRRACRFPTARSTPIRSPSACATSPTSTRRLREAHRVLRPGGRFYCLEFSKVTSAPVGRVYDAYSERALPLFGRRGRAATPSPTATCMRASAAFPSQRELARAHAARRASSGGLAQHDPRRGRPAFGLADLIRTEPPAARAAQQLAPAARHAELRAPRCAVPARDAGHRAGADRLGAALRGAPRCAPAGRAAGGGAAGDGAELHQARPGAVDARRSLERGGRRRSRAAAGPPAGLSRRRGARDDRARARPEGRGAVTRSFDDTPIAAASIAQVHFATTTDGRAVAVKVLRPGIEAAFARDLDLFYWMAELVERTQPRFRRLKPVESVKAFADVVRVEMDLRMEAAAAEELGENFRDDPDYRAPGDRLGPHRPAGDDPGAGRRHRRSATATPSSPPATIPTS